MPVLSKEKHDRIQQELVDRFYALKDAFNGRELLSSREGAARGSWSNPGLMTATIESKVGLSLAVDDLKSILSEIKKLK